MGRKMKKLTRAGAGALAGVMVFGLAAPLAPLSVEAADEVKNLAIGSTATVNDKETDYWGADKAVDGIVNRTAAKRDQSRWATNVGGDADAKWLKIDLKEAKTFQSFVLAWERRNITGYKIQISQTGEDNSWEDVYTKTGASHISHINENIHLPEAKTARYVRLYIDGYTANAADDQTNWRSVSLYDFQIYANEIPDTVLPDENYCLEGTAEASNFEEVQSEPGKQGPAKAIDGDLTTRWATESDGKGTTARTLTVKLPAAQWVEYVKIDWEMPASGVPTPKKYTIEAAEKEGGEFTVVHTNSEQVTKAEQIIKLDKPVWAKELKLNVTEYGAATGTWYNVSVAEFGAYAMKPESGVIDENATAKQIADKLAAPTVKADKTGLEWQDVPEGVTVEFLADYEQVVGRDGKIYQPLRETTVKGIYKVTKGEETAEGAREHTVTIPGKYDNAGTNAKPVVIPELAEWYGGTEAGSVKIGEGTKIVYKDAAFKAAAEALAADYKAEYGVDLQVADSGEDAGDIVFTKDDKNGLGEEGYIMEMDDKVNVKAEQAQGAYWSTRSILQIVKLNNGEIPKGITKDYPKFKVRSFSLDVARKPASLESLEDFVDAMAYYKMNDFQVHLNDNLIFYENFESAEVARERAYTGFRLESDIKAGGENKKDLTNEDLFYTKEDFRNFIEESEAQGVSIVPEIDAPGHSGAFTKVRPDLMLPQNQAVNGNAKRAGEQFDLSGDVNSKDSQYGKSLSFVQGVWDEYLTDNMFDDSMTVHIGTDEYYGEENAFRHFSDDMIKYIQGKDRTVRMWGSLTQIDGDGTVPVKSENVQLNVWNTGYSNTLKTVLIVDGKEYQATGIYINRQTDNTLRKQGIKNATLLLPVQRIGSKTNSIVGTIDNVEVKTADPISSKDEYNKAAWTKVSVDTETNIADSKTEGLFTYAFDGKSNTIWHSNWKDGKSDKLKPQGSFDEIGGVINLGQKYTINQFSFTPRQGNASGQVTKADLYVKANEGDEWVKVAENTEFAADASKKTFYFDEQEVQFVKFVAKTSNDGWVAVSEFDVDNEKVKEMTVYAAAQKGGKVTSSAKDGKVMQHENVTVTATPNKEYKFAGWYDILTGEKVSDDAEYTFAVEMNTSLIAHFTKNGETPDPQPKEWTVTIDGTGHKVKDGETLTVEEPSKPGHAFAGFYLVGTDTAVDFTKPITSDMNVESRFTQYKVTAVESENGTITVSEMNDKGEVTVTAKANDGYIFKGWKVDGKETEALGTPYTFVPVKDTTVEAVYEKKDDTKVYHTVIINGQTVTVEDGKTLDRPADPVKEGYKFIGWFVDGKEFDFNTPITGDLKIEARFEKLPTTDKNDKNDKNDKVEGAVQTGDTANAVPWIVCLGVAAGAGVVVLKSRKKRS